MMKISFTDSPFSRLSVLRFSPMHLSLGPMQGMAP